MKFKMTYPCAFIYQFQTTFSFFFIPVIDAAYGDMFPHKHKLPIPFPIPGWDPDTNPWDESLYPPFKQQLNRRHGKR